jgi:hypothetical protein
MKILKVIVDEIPNSCINCEFLLLNWNATATFKRCLLIGKPLCSLAVRDVDCPLVPTDTLEAQNARTANEVM